MITAKEAHELTIASDKNVSDFLDDKIRPLIEIAISQGKFECTYYIDAEKVTANLPVSNFNIRIVSELKSLGYYATVSWYGDSYLPRSMDAETSTKYDHIRNYGILISWANK